MKVTYLNHSGFLLEWEHCYWIFDYYQGQIPELDEKKRIFVFCSHSHEDHFNPAVFALAQSYPSVKYVFSAQVRSACRKIDRNAKGVYLSREQIAKVCEKERKMDAGEKRLIPLPEITFLTGRASAELEDGVGERISVFTLRSTDCGCAFLLSYQGKTIYHAGDLHWWVWPGEQEEYNRQMTGKFKKEMEYLAGSSIDVAFAPLDGRLEQWYAKGMAYLLEHAQVRHMFPMHFWEEYSVMDRYLAEHPVPENTQFYRIDRDGESWEIQL